MAGRASSVNGPVRLPAVPGVPEIIAPAVISKLRGAPEDRIDLKANNLARLGNIQGGGINRTIDATNVASASEYTNAIVERPQTTKSLEEDSWLDDVGNFAAGVVNGLIPGSNIGNTNSFYAPQGEFVGEAIATIYNPTEIALTVIKKGASTVSFLSNAIDKAGSIISNLGESPIVQTIAGQAVKLGTQYLAQQLAPQQKASAVVQQPNNVQPIFTQQQDAVTQSGNGLIRQVVGAANEAVNGKPDNTMLYVLGGAALLILLLKK